MARLLGKQYLGGGRVEKHWLHTGADGTDRITTEIVQDAAPIIASLRHHVDAETLPQRKEMRLKARIPITMMDEAAKVHAAAWGVTSREAFSEIVKQKTDRAKRALRELTDGRDYRKLQAEHYRI